MTTTLSTAEIISAERIRWSLLDTDTIYEIRSTAGAYGDTRLVALATRALARRGE